MMLTIANLVLLSCIICFYFAPYQRFLVHYSDLFCIHNFTIDQQMYANLISVVRSDSRFPHTSSLATTDYNC